MASDGKSLHIAIIGGSLGGLLAAVPLLRRPERHTVTILERSGTPLLHDQGAGIVAGHNLRKWVEQHDLWKTEATVSVDFYSFFTKAMTSSSRQYGGQVGIGFTVVANG